MEPLIEDDLFVAVLSGDRSQIEANLIVGNGINAINDLGESLLHVAVVAGDPSIVKLLLDAGINIESQDIQGFTALVVSVLAENAELTKMLLDYGASTQVDVNIDGERFTLSQIADGLSNSEIVALIYPERRDEIAESKRRKAADNALRNAAAQNNLVELKTLLSSGAVINAMDSEGWTALTYAASNGHVEAIHFLIEQGADIDISANRNITPVAAAVIAGHSEAVNVFIDKKTNLEVLVDDKLNLLNIAIAQNDAALIKILEPHFGKPLADLFDFIEMDDSAGFASFSAKNPYTLNQVNEQGWTPLMVAVAKGSEPITAYILKEMPFLARKKSPSGLSPLSIAAKSGNELIVEHLLRSGAPLEAVYEGLSVHEIANRSGHHSVSRKLKERLTTQTKQLQSQLMWFGISPGPYDGIPGSNLNRALAALSKLEPSVGTMTHSDITNYLNEKNKNGVYVCNLTQSEKLWYVKLYVPTSGGSAKVMGWFSVERNNCSKARETLQGLQEVYFHATDGKYEWGSDEYRVCIHGTDAFQFDLPKPSCNGKGEVLKKFSRYRVGTKNRISVEYTD